MPRDSAWRTSPTRRSQVSAGARPAGLQPSAAARLPPLLPSPPGRPAPSSFPLLLRSWGSLSGTALPDAAPPSAPGGGCSRGRSRGEGVRLGCLIVCTRGSVLPPARPRSLGSGARAPPSPWAPAGPAGERGTPGGGRGARAGRRAGRQARAPRSGKLGRTAAAVCPAPQSEWRLPRSRPRAGGGGGETRGAPLAALSRSFREAERSAPGPGAGAAGGTPAGDPAPGRRQFRAGLGRGGEFLGRGFRGWRGLSRYGSSVLSRLRLVTRGSEDTPAPGAAPGTRARARRPPVLSGCARSGGGLAGGSVPGSAGPPAFPQREPGSPPHPLSGRRRRVGSTRSPAACAAARVRVLRLLAPTESELLCCSVNETCRGARIRLREAGGRREGAGRSIPAARVLGDLRCSKRNAERPPASLRVAKELVEGGHASCRFLKASPFPYVMQLLFCYA